MLGPWLWSGWKPRRFGSNLGGIFQSFRILGQWLCTWISKKWSDTWSNHVGPSHLALFSDLPQVFQVAIFESQLTRQWLDPKKRRKCPSLMPKRDPLMIFQCVIWPFCYSNDVKSPQNWQMQKKNKQILETCQYNIQPLQGKSAQEFHTSNPSHCCMSCCLLMALSCKRFPAVSEFTNCACIFMDKRQTSRKHMQTELWWLICWCP